MNAIIYNYKIWINSTDTYLLLPKLREILRKSEYNVLNFIEHSFVPQGYTCLWLLAESHLALHTFPEQNNSYIELSSCNKAMNERFVVEVEAWLSADKITYSKTKEQISKP